MLAPHSVGLGPAGAAWPIVCPAAAHPAKFPDSVDAALGRQEAHHPALDAVAAKPQRKTHAADDVAAVRNFIAARATWGRRLGPPSVRVWFGGGWSGAAHRLLGGGGTSAA